MTPNATLTERLTGLCRDIARQAQAAGVTLGAPSRDDLDLLRAVLNGERVGEREPGGEGSGTGNDRQPASCAAPTPSGPQHFDDLTAGVEVEFFGRRMVVVTAEAGVVELIAPDTEERT